MNIEKKLIPRKIWLIWFQGVSKAPFIVKECIDSWVRKNPTWDIVILDSNNLQNYINLNISGETLDNVSLVHQSDLVRLLVLSEYGGVWADSTTFCTKPLDEWIDRYAESGFFVFHKPGKDRIMSSWFIASEINSPICTKLYNNLRSYWTTNDFSKPTSLKRKLTSILSIILNQSSRTTRYWFNPLVTKIMKVYPYFVLHYMFEKLVSEDKESKAIWRNTKRLSADPPHLIQKLGLHTRLTQSIKKQLDNNDIPLFKLTWKYDHSRYSADTLLYYILEKDKG